MQQFWHKQTKEIATIEAELLFPNQSTGLGIFSFVLRLHVLCFFRLKYWLLWFYMVFKIKFKLERQKIVYFVVLSFYRIKMSEDTQICHCDFYCKISNRAFLHSCITEGQRFFGVFFPSDTGASFPLPLWRSALSESSLFKTHELRSRGWAAASNLQ